MTPRVIVADRSPLVRLAVRVALSRSGIEVVAEAGDAPAVLKAVSVHSPDAMLFDAELDLDMTVLAQIHSAAPDCALVVLAPDDSESSAMAAVRAGACGYLPKSTPPERLPAVIHGVLAGEAAIPRRLVRKLLVQVNARHAGLPAAALSPDAEPLTSREWEVIDMLSKGLSDRHVSERLGVSDVTVRRHAASAARKLRASRREDAVAIFRRAVA
jgi:DNA-binding NarL/FixJ family response regulator